MENIISMIKERAKGNEELLRGIIDKTFYYYQIEERNIPKEVRDEVKKIRCFRINCCYLTIL